MKKRMMILMIAAVTVTGSVYASQMNAIENTSMASTLEVFHADEASIPTYDSNSELVVSNHINVKKILRLNKIKLRKHKWRKARKILRKQKRKFRKVRSKVRMNHSRSIIQT